METQTAAAGSRKKPRARREAVQIALAPPPCPIWLIYAWADDGHSGSHRRRVVAIRSTLKRTWWDDRPDSPEIDEDLLVVDPDMGYAPVPIEDVVASVNVVYEVLVDPSEHDKDSAAERVERRARVEFLGEHPSVAHDRVIALLQERAELAASCPPPSPVA